MRTQSQRIYLDYNATAPLLPAARERMLEALDEFPGNASSPHGEGQAARDALERVRAGLAELLGFTRREVLFTSGGTEGNNMLLRWPGLEALPATGGSDAERGEAGSGDTGAAADEAGAGHVITSPIEHPSVLKSLEWLRGRGVRVDTLPVDGNGVADVEAVDAMIRPDTRLISLMAANNETGVLQPVTELVERVRRAQGDRWIVVHCDAVQAFGRLPVRPGDWGVDAVTVSAHKLGGPKGIGAVAIREGVRIPGLILGGSQERERRAGTEPVFLAAGFLGAAEWTHAHLEELRERLLRMRERLIASLSGIEGFFLNGSGAERLPNTVNLGFEGVSAQSLLVALDLGGIAVSIGSACSSGAVEPSHVLRAMGLPEGRLTQSLRISLGHATAEQEIDRCAETLQAEVKRLRGLEHRAAS